MSAIVTGAAGFVGSHLVDRLLREGATVIGVDNLATGRLQNLADAAVSERFTFVNADVSDPSTLGALQPAPAADVAVVFHLASPASPIDYAELPLETLAVNSEGTRHAIDLALRVGARLVYASTSEVYGDPLVHPQREDYWGNVNPNGPRSCYDEAKRFGEALIAAYVRTRGLDARVARIFNTYGPRMRPHDGRVVPTMIGQALRGEPPTIYGDGSQTRSLCYVDDLVDGLVRLAMSRAARDQVVNLGNADERTVLEIATLICDLTGRPHEFSWRPLPQDDPTRRRPDTTRARALLGWHPAVELADGLRATIAYFASGVYDLAPVRVQYLT